MIHIVIGVVLLGVGIAASGGPKVFIGAIIVGIIQIVRGLFALARD